MTAEGMMEGRVEDEEGSPSESEEDEDARAISLA
jgi:hypothetical protein